MSNVFLLDMQSKVPIYEQIQTQILKFINAGVLAPGDRLPSIRQLAKDNGINPNTVAKAFSLLADKGVLTNVPKKGYYIAGTGDEPARRDRILSVLEALKENGITKQEILDCLNDIYEGGQE